jgi:tellurite resistance protein
MDKFDFMGVVAEQFEGLTTEKEIEERAKQMIEIIKHNEQMAKHLLKVGVL